MSNFKIDAIGPYRQHDGERAEVKFIDGDRAYGRDSTGRSRVWCTNNGSEQDDFPSYSDIVARWPRFAVGDRVRVVDDGGIERSVTVTLHSNCSSFRCMVEDGFWAAGGDESELFPDDRPVPPEGFELRDRETCHLNVGDMLCERGKWIGPVGLGNQYTCVQMDAMFTHGAPHYIASPIKRDEQKPFRISDNGPGVYERRDGKHIKIVETADRMWKGVQYVWADENGWTYIDDGVNNHENKKSRHDLVRYIGPLPNSAEPEQWVPTCELSWNKCPHNVRGATIVSTEDHALNEVCRLEQRWTCGDKSEWRPIPVEVQE